jgi:hypothetical protein
MYNKTKIKLQILNYKAVFVEHLMPLIMANPMMPIH